MGNEYLYGRSFLIVPVTQPFYARGEKETSSVDFSRVQRYPVYLPEGADWYDFWTEEKIVGGTNLQREVPVDVMPVYVKAGSIIPSSTAVQYASEKNWDRLELRIYPGASAEFDLYEDENDGYAYEKGIFSIIKIQWNDAARTLTLADRQGEFPGMLKRRTFRITLAGENKTTKEIQYNGKLITINL
jgi:alpha-D-xyloside xylohydrolase